MAAAATGAAGAPPPRGGGRARPGGARLSCVLGAATRLGDLGDAVAPGLHEAELDHLWREEWARSAEDVLRRRSKLALHVDEAAAARVAQWMAARAGAAAAAPGDDRKERSACN